MDIKFYGNDPRLSVCQKRLSSRSSEGTLYLLPIPSFKAGDTPPFADLSPKAGDAVVGYGIPSAESAKLTQNGARFLDLANDDAYQKESAETTALGILFHLCQGAAAVPSDLSVGIVGFGKIGQALLKILVFFGAKLSVYTRNPLSQKDLSSLGIDVYPSSSFAYHGEDVLINTAPACLLHRDAFPGAIPRIYDVATGNAVAEDVPHQKLPALPRKLFEVSAADSYCRAVERFLSEEQG